MLLKFVCYFFILLLLLSASFKLFSAVVVVVVVVSDKVDVDTKGTNVEDSFSTISFVLISH